jgi:serine/threonine protein kinase
LDLIEGLHSTGIIHCDFKPDNVLIGSDKSAMGNKSIELNINKEDPFYLIDYGISQRYLNE